MKKLIFETLLALSFFLMSSTATAQRIAIVDIAQVLNAMPEYKQAQEDLDKISQRWRQEIAQEQDQIKAMYSRYTTEKVLMNDEAQRTAENEITAREQKVREKQREKFGPEGELFRKRQELVKPIQDRVYAAIERFAAEKGYELILDKGASAGVIFATPSMEKTQAIIDALKR